MTRAIDVGVADVGELLSSDGWRDRAASATGASRPAADLDFAPLIPRPEKIICVGLELPEPHPRDGTRAARVPDAVREVHPAALIGAHDDVVLPVGVRPRCDWEAELAVIIGTRVRHVSPDEGEAADRRATRCSTTCRSATTRTAPSQWLQGKTFESSTPLGPVPRHVGRDPGPAPREISCEVDGEVKQKSDTADLVFDPATLVSYISDIITLAPGDVIATGTPGGVGFTRNPKEFLKDGSVMITRIAGVGELRNVCRRETA